MVLQRQLNEEDIKNLIRRGITSKDVEDIKSSLLQIGNTPESINKEIQLCKDFESGKLKISCTLEDKKRILREDIPAYKQAGLSDKDILEMYEEDFKAKTCFIDNAPIKENMKLVKEVLSETTTEKPKPTKPDVETALIKKAMRQLEASTPPEEFAKLSETEKRKRANKLK